MGKNKGAPVRRPVKAKGTIPTPKAGYRSARKHWYQHRQFQVVGGLIALVIIGFGVQQFMAWRDRVENHNAEKKAVKAFDTKVQSLQTEIINPLTDMTAKPEQFRNGQIKADEYRAAAQTWLTAFQKMATELRSQSPPESLADTRAHMVEAAVVFIDAVRTYQIAAQTTEPAVRDQTILMASREINHGQVMYTNALRTLQLEKKRLGLPTGTIPPSPQLPQEDVSTTDSTTPGATTPGATTPPTTPAAPSPAPSPTKK